MNQELEVGGGVNGLFHIWDQWLVPNLGPSVIVLPEAITLQLPLLRAGCNQLKIGDFPKY